MTTLEQAFRDECERMGLTLDDRTAAALADGVRAGLQFDAALAALRTSLTPPPGALERMATALRDFADGVR